MKHFLTILLASLLAFAVADAQVVNTAPKKTQKTTKTTKTAKTNKTTKKSNTKSNTKTEKKNSDLPGQRPPQSINKIQEKKSINNSKTNATKKPLTKAIPVSASTPEENYNLGEKYYYGTGVNKDYTQAAYYFRYAAEQGHAEAQNYLGHMYQFGCGVTQDYTEAVKWYRKAADQGNAAAQYALGIMYQYGYGVEQSKWQARYWYQQAANQGNEDARLVLKRLNY